MAAKLDLIGYIEAEAPVAADRLELPFAEKLKSLRHDPDRFPKIREKFHAKFIDRHIFFATVS